MPLTEKGKKVLAKFREEYGEKGESYFYASINSGKLKGMDTDEETMDNDCACHKPRPPIVIRFNRRRR